MRVAFFLDGVAGRLFCSGTRHPDPGMARGRILIVAPFAEEMNKSRHVLSALARATGDAGFDVLMPDLFGTGDSEGSFSDATMAVWRSDLDAAIDAIQGVSPLHIIGLRAGSLLAVDCASRHKTGSLTLLHPQTDGRQIVNQMLRLRLAGGLLGGGEKETAAQLRERLASGEILEIAGYGLSGRLVADLESLAMEKMGVPDIEQANWIELAAQADRPLMPVSMRIVESWAAAGVPVHTAVVNCDQFWATQEIAHCPVLVHHVMQRFAG